MKTPHPISIWQPQERNGETVWVRPPLGPFDDHYAQLPELHRKRATLPLRVLLFGESVAAGYLYAPALTPAKVLESQLQAIGGRERFEVVDLARTNETLDGLRATLRASLQINPDVLVILVGNNWTLLEAPEVTTYSEDPAARRAFAEALDEHGWTGPAELAWLRVAARARATFDEIAQIARTIGIPVLVVIPEVNLPDWENRQPVHWLPADGIARWHAGYDAAVAALAAGEPQAALDACGVLQQLDEGLCPSTWRLRARALADLGDAHGAAEAARAEVASTAHAQMAFLAAPQASMRVQALLRELARQWPLTAIDLPEVFAAHGGTPAPGKRYFLDYCHFSREGIAVAMAAVASKVLELSGVLAQAPEWPEVLARVGIPVVPPAVDAVACLGAAMHGAHRLLSSGDKSRWAEHWCRAALAADPAVADTMLDLALARSAGCEAVLNAAFHRNAASAHRLSLQHGWRWAQLDADLLAAIRQLLPEHAARIDAAIGAADAGEELELCAPPWRWLWEPLERFHPEVMPDDPRPQCGYLRCPWPRASFVLPAGAAPGPAGLVLRASVRLPAALGQSERLGMVGVHVNGQAIARFEASQRWSRAELRVPPSVLRAGLNQLTLSWPMPPPLELDPRAWLAERLAHSRERVDLHPLFGEVHSLRVRARTGSN